MIRAYIVDIEQNIKKKIFILKLTEMMEYLLYNLIQKIKLLLSLRQRIIVII